MHYLKASTLRPQCPLWVISGQTIAGQNPPLSAVTPIADKRGCGWKCLKRRNSHNRFLKCVDKGHHVTALVGIRQGAAHRAEIVCHVRRIGRTGDYRGHPRVAEQVFEEELGPAGGEGPSPLGNLYRRTARKSRARPNGRAVNTPALTSLASGRIRLSTVRSSSE